MKTFVKLSVLDRELHRTLARLYRQQEVEAYSRRKVQQPAGHSAVSGRKCWLAAAMVMLSFGVLMALVLSGDWNRRGRVTSVPHLATLTDLRGAVFDASDVPTTVGSRLPEGVMRLRSGKVDIEFLSGAVVTVEGPAVFELHPRLGGALQHGIVDVHCPPSAKGFALRTPNMAVVDLGTRFVLQVDEDGASRVNVVQGEVGRSADSTRRSGRRWRRASTKIRSGCAALVLERAAPSGGQLSVKVQGWAHGRSYYKGVGVELID